MEGQTLVILIVSMVAALLWLVLRFGRQIARAVLVLGILILGILTALALLSQASAARQAAKAATVAVSGQAVSSVMTAFCLGGLTAALVSAMGAAGVFWIRWQLAEHNRQRLRRRTRPKVLPHTNPPEVVYIVEDEDNPLPIGDLDLSFWGW
jgi:O-antigen/teichoic acid export membrane protein